MRILAPVFFLSFLAGKIKIFQQKLLKATIKFKKKKTAPAYFGARIFSKSFGGKIEHGQTNVIKETTFTEKKMT